MSSVYYLYPTTLSENEGAVYATYGTATMNDVYGSFDDETGGYTRVDAFSGLMRRLTFNLTDFLPITTGIESATVGARMWNKNGGWFNGELIVKVGVTNYLYNFVGGSTGAYTSYEHPWATNPATAAAWTVADLNALIAGCGWSSRAGTKEYKTTAVYVRVTYAGAPALAPQARDIASRRVFDLGANKALVSLSIPLETGKLVDVMDDLPVVHWAGPHDSAAGWQQNHVWEARLTKVYGISIDPNDSSVSVQLRDRRPALCLMQDTAWSLKSSSAEALGIARIDKGCTRTHTRTGDAFVLAPGSLTITKVLENEEMYGSVGQMHQRGAVNNEVIQSGFKNGAADTYTGWTKSVSGTNPFIIDYDEVAPIWEPISTGVVRSVLISAGNPLGAGPTQLASTATASMAANTKLRFSGWHYDFGSNPAWWNLTRNIDNLGWHDATSTWATAGGFWNVTPLSDLAWGRVISKEIDVGAGATTLTLKVGGGTAAEGTVAGQQNLWGHVQLERETVAPTTAGTWVGGEILTEAALVTRNASKLTISNNTAARCWNAAQGAFVCEVIPQWSTAELGNKNATIAWIDFGASNWVWYGYDGVNDRFFAEIRAGGTTYRAFKSTTLVAGQVYVFGARHTGSNGELDLTPFTLSVFIDTVKGTDVVMAAAVTETATSDLEIGSKAALEHFNGVVRLAHSYQWVPTDSEMARLPA